MSRIVPMTPEEERKFLKELGLTPLPPEELKRRELAARRLKERLSHDPFYASTPEDEMQPWRNLHGHAVLQD